MLHQKEVTMKLYTEHIGYLTNNIEETAREFALFGYQADDVFNDDTQKTRICFLRKEGEVNLELVEPYEDNPTMRRFLEKHGIGPYHVCYECDDIDTIYAGMCANNWRPLFSPVAAPAFGNRLICYFYKKKCGFIEFVNKK